MPMSSTSRSGRIFSAIARGERDGEQRNAEMAERHGEGKIRSADTVCGGGRG
jgi:hypothetical protein